MFSHSFYKVLHLTCILAVFLALGAQIMIGKLKANGNIKLRRFAAITHGIAMTLVLVSGFGMLARLSVQWPFPAWTFLKIAIWLFMGAALGLAKRKPQLAGPLWIALIVAGFFAAFLGVTKPIL